MTKLNLDDFQPSPHEVTLRGQTYKIPAEVPIPFMIGLLGLRQEISTAQQRDDEEGMAAAMGALYQEVMGLFREHNPDVGDLPLTASDLPLIMGLVAGGAPGIGLEDAVTDALLGEGSGGPTEAVPLNRSTRRRAAQAKSRARKSA